MTCTSCAALRPRRRWMAALLCCALAIPPHLRATAAEVLPNLGDESADDLSPLAERKLGEEIMRQAHTEGDIFEDPESTEYLNTFGAILVAHAPPDAPEFEFFLVLDPSINAFALPGGFIGVNTGLITSTQSESELASVMSHEMGHVIQRHIARGISHEKQTSILAMAAMFLGALAMAKSNSSSISGGNAGNAGEAIVAMGESYLIEDELSFSRDKEREADRVGFQILQDSGFDVAAMAAFFERLQVSTRAQDSGAPEWLRDHPMTTERIADIQNRIRVVHYRQRPDSMDFNLIRARLRVLQDTTVQGLRDARIGFEEQLKTGAYASEPAIHYGLALVLLRQRNYDGAQHQLDLVNKELPGHDVIIQNFSIKLLSERGDATAAVKAAAAAQDEFPQSRMLALSYAEALQKSGQDDAAISYLRKRVALYRHDAALYELLAKSYAAKSQTMLEHKAMAENYYLRGSVQAALEQLRIARRYDNGDFYEQSEIDARIRELQAEWTDLQKSKKDDKSS